MANLTLINAEIALQHALECELRLSEQAKQEIKSLGIDWIE